MSSVPGVVFLSTLVALGLMLVGHLTSAWLMERRRKKDRDAMILTLINTAKEIGTNTEAGKKYLDIASQMATEADRERRSRRGHRSPSDS